ncbi:6723_t:CDS:2 [Paraglomus occultum]|uniref:6723_t:CDS:1 n=1 Tax=Paraglomus occultum TaxID=144539 RepID=A0A9N9F5Y4_9GLOM|nr:6723_t:CDS:2 [Paraglomus occultum]
MTKNTPLITFCQRPGFGDEGNGLRKKTEVLTNRFEVRMKKTSIYYQYIVEFYFVRRNEDESYRTERIYIPDFGKLRRRIFNTFQTSHQSDIFQNFGAAYDGGNIVYTTGKLTLGENGCSELVELNDDRNYAGEYYIEIKNHDEPEISLEGLGAVLTSNNFEWDFFDNKGLKMINAFLYHKPLLKYTQYGKSIFDRETKQSLGGGLELWRGLFASARPGDGKVYLNVNLSYMTAYEPVNLERWICNFIGKERLPDEFDGRTVVRIGKAIRNIKVRPLHRPECKTKYIVCKLHDKNAHQAKFTDKDGKQISVAEHFKNAYGVTLKTGHLIETSKGNVLLPIEYCEIIEGQRYLRRLTGEQCFKINRITTKRPGTNKGLILNIKKVLLLEQEGLFQQAGFAVDMEMALVPAHFKEMPELTFSSSGRSISVKPKEFDATWKLHDIKFFKGGEKLQSLFATSFLPKTSSKQVEGFLRQLGAQVRKLGMEVSTETPQVECVQWGNDERRAHEEILKILKNKKSKNCLPQLVFYILKGKVWSCHQYNLVKIISDTEVGILSQCIQAQHINCTNMSRLSNVALKLNLKLNGINYIMDPPRIKKVFTMFLGTAITHLSPGVPSIAAVVGSVDEHAVQYVERHRLLHRLLRKKSKKSRKTGRGNEEVNVDMIDMVYELLCEFKGARKSFPQSLIMCRSGISESEFQSLALETELPSIKAACHKVDPNYNPSITYIVACKVRKTRFYPKHRFDSDKTGNVKPGLTVERDITHPQFFEFYIKSHSNPQGTSRPSRYCVLYDENRFGSDEIQDLLHKLCYNFQRSPGAVSIPAPIYYAQCVVKRAKLHFDGGQMFMTKSSLATRYPMYYV